MSSKGGKRSGGKSAAEDKREDVLQAVIIADSFQTRFRPFSLEKPRCLLPIANTPLIEYTLEFLAMNGVQQVFIYAGNHQAQVEKYIGNSRWCSSSKFCPFSSLEFIRVSDARSVGDFLRDLDKRSSIEGDFILVHGDLVSNIQLGKALAAHKARKEANSESIMTMVLRENGEDDHRTKVKGMTPVFIVDPAQKRCLHYEEMNPLQQDHYITIDPDHLKIPELEIRTDLIDAQIDICTPDVLALWSESFDYELPRANYLHGVLKDHGLNGKMVHTEIVSAGYSARATNLQMFEAISKDVLSGWTFPFEPHGNMMMGQTYQERDDNVCVEDDVELDQSCQAFNTVIGKGTHVGSASTLTNTVIGRDCKIGSNVQISDSFIWGDVIIEDGAVIERAIIAESAVIGKAVQIAPGCLLGSGVQISSNISIPQSTVISLLSANSTPLSPDPKLVGTEGKGARFVDPDFDELDMDDPARLQNSLIYSLDDFDITESSVSTLASDSDGLSDTVSHSSHVPGSSGSRTRSFSIGSTDSTTHGSSVFLSEAISGLLEALRKRGDFGAEKLEFTSLRLANNASDAAVRRAIATAFVQRATELVLNSVEPVKAAKNVVSENEGANTFLSEVGVGGDDVQEQVEFALAIQRACTTAAKKVDVPKAGNLLAAFFKAMYEDDVFEEEGILGWWNDSRSQDGEGQKLREKCQALVTWLEEAEEESDSDDE